MKKKKEKVNLITVLVMTAIGLTILSISCLLSMSVN